MFRKHPNKNELSKNAETNKANNETNKANNETLNNKKSSFKISYHLNDGNNSILS